MEHTFDVKVSQRDADTALRRFILRGAGWGSVMAVVLCLAYVAHDFSDGDISHLGVAILTLILILGLGYIAAYVVRRRQMADLLDRIGDGPVFYRLSESEISTQSSLGSSALKWEMIKKLWIDPDLTLVFYARNGYTTIPTDQIPPTALDFLVSQVRRDDGIIGDNTRD